MACIKLKDYVYLIAKIGNGVMLQSQLERFMSHYLRISNKTVYRHIKELEANEIISVQKINKVNLISLKKYAYRFIKQEETGMEVKSKDISSPRVTEGKIKKSVWISEYILRTIIKDENINDIMGLINYLDNATTLNTSKSDSIRCFDNFVHSKNINFTVRENMKSEICKINDMRSVSKKNLAAESKIKSKKQTNIKQAKQIKDKNTKTIFTFNSMFYNNLYVTNVTTTQVSITYLDVSNILNKSKMMWIIENVYDYFCDSLLSYTENYEVKSDITITIQILTDSKKQAIKMKKVLQERETFLQEKMDTKQINKKEMSSLNMLQKLDIKLNYLDISINCFKNSDIIF